jgi:probable addiction module antidote protein
MPIETFPFDPAELLTDPESQLEILEDAFASGHQAYIAEAIGAVARARGMTATAKAAGVTREALHKALSPEGNPTLTTLLGVTRALGYRLSLRPLDPEPGSAGPG